MKQQESCVEPQCYVMICSRDTSLEHLAENVRYMSEEVSDRRSASNGMLNLHVTWESVPRQPIILLRPDVTSNPPEISSNATLELQKLDLRLEFAKTIEEEWQAGAESRELEQKAEEGSTLLDQVKRELEVVEDELRKLAERRRLLIECRENGAQERVQVNERQREIKKRQEDIFKRQLYTQQRWKEIHSINYNGDSSESEAMDFQTLLRWAAENGHEVMVKQLLSKGHIDINFYARIPLLLAARNGHEATVRLLLEVGANIESKNKYGQTPLLYAAIDGHEAIVRLLLEEGADIESKGKYGQTPLSCAAINGHKAIVRLLLEEGSNIELKSKSGQTPLAYAARNGHEATVQLLLEKGANIESKSKSGRTPLSYATENGHEAVVELLLGTGKVGADSKDNASRTPLL
jgi:ankyrin repeat protein